jgi:hypothetical protein
VVRGPGGRVNDCQARELILHVIAEMACRSFRKSVNDLEENRGRRD